MEYREYQRQCTSKVEFEESKDEVKHKKKQKKKPSENNEITQASSTVNVGQYSVVLPSYHYFRLASPSWLSLPVMHNSTNVQFRRWFFSCSLMKKKETKNKREEGTASLRRRRRERVGKRGERRSSMRIKNS